jgi:protein required for attachment to host cells
MAALKIRSRDLVAVLDGRKAIILRNDGDAFFPSLVVVEARDHEQPPDRELHDDRPGRVHQSAASFRSSVEVTDRHDEAERAFVVGVSTRLDELISADKHCGIVVVAPPRALGFIRAAHSPAVLSALRGEFDHDWVHLPVHEIEKRLTQA